jgi:hypothetical protein
MFSFKGLMTFAALGVTFLPASAQAQNLPKHTVLAFNMEACPKGWTPYKPAEGAFVVGAGGTFSLGAGGAASMDKWVLTSDQLPSFTATGHYGNLPFAENAPTGTRAFTISASGPQVTPTDINVSGGNAKPKPIPVPKIAGLTFCEKL